MSHIPTNLMRAKSLSQPDVGKVIKVSKSDSVRSFVWKNALKRNVKGEAKNQFFESQSNKKPTGFHKRTKIDPFFDFTDDYADADDEDEDGDSESDVDPMNDVEMDDNSDEDWDKEDAKKLEKEIKNHPKKAKRRVSENSDILATKSSEQVDTEMDYIFNFFPRQCQLELNNNDPTDLSSEHSHAV